MPKDLTNVGWSDRQFIYRTYEENCLRIRLIGGTDTDPEKIAHYSVEIRIGDPTKPGDCIYMSNVYGPSQFDAAADTHKTVMRRYFSTGALPKW